MTSGHQDLLQNVEAVASEATHHELPNFLTILHNLFPESGIAQFLLSWENVFFSGIIASLIIFVSIYAAKKKSFIPEGIENFCELMIEGIETFVVSILGKKGRAYAPFIGTLFVYILLMNWVGLIPFFKSPTSSWGTTIALALATTIYIQWIGIREQGPYHYVKHMMGDPKNLFGIFLIPIMLVINLSIEYFAVPLSLSLRLFANISSEDRLLYKFAELNVLFYWIPFAFQIFANVLAIIFSIVQAFVFMLLTTVYISLVLPHEDHEENSEELLLNKKTAPTK